MKFFFLKTNGQKKKKTLLRSRQTFPNTEPDPGKSVVFQRITQDPQETREGGQGEQAQRQAGPEREPRRARSCWARLPSRSPSSVSDQHTFLGTCSHSEKHREGSVSVVTEAHLVHG